MARKVFVSSKMGTDEQLLIVAERHPLAPLLWPWFLTAFDDWGRAEYRPRELKARTFPGFDAVTPDAIAEAIGLYAEVGLLLRYAVAGREYMALPPEKWFEYQTHIRREKREHDESRIPPPPPDLPCSPRESAREIAQPRAEARENEPSPSPSPSPTDPVTDAREDVPAAGEHDGEAPPLAEADNQRSEQRDKPPAYTRPFLAFWAAYPRKENKAEAWKAWNKLRPPPDLCDEIMTGLTHWQQSRQWTEGIYQHASTWLNRRQWEDEPEVAPTTPKERRNGRYPDRSTADAAPLNHGRFRPASARASPTASGVAVAPPPDSGA